MKEVKREQETFKYVNALFHDLSSYLVSQNQLSVIDQSANWGGVNLAFNYQNQNATA